MDAALNPGEEAPVPGRPAWRAAVTGVEWVCLPFTLATVWILCLWPIEITDFWWQARTGELILTEGAIPTRDVFSWTSFGEPWQVHEWLTEVLFALMLRHAAGWSLLAYKSGLAVVVAGLVIWRTARRTGSVAAGCAAALAMAWVLRYYADVRPQMLSFVLLAGTLLAMDAYREGRARWWPWCMPLLFVVWANLHGGVVVGLGLVAIWCVGEGLGVWWLRGRSPGLGALVFSTAASALAVMLNPNGFQVYAYPFHVLGHPRVIDYIVEWYSPNFHEPRARGFEILLLGTPTAALLLASTGGFRAVRSGPGEWLVLAAMAHAALMFDRNTVPFALAAAPVFLEGITLLARAGVARLASPPVAGALRSVAATGVAVAAIFCLVREWPRETLDSGAVRRLPVNRWQHYATGMSGFPRMAADRLAAGDWPGNFYNDYVWGGYLLWRLYPRRRVFIDGRAEIYYRSGAFDDEMLIHRTQEGWREALNRRHVAVVITRQGGLLDRALRRTSGWQLTFTGESEAVFVRAGAAFAPTPAGASRR